MDTERKAEKKHDKKSKNTTVVERSTHGNKPKTANGNHLHTTYMCMCCSSSVCNRVENPNPKNIPYVIWMIIYRLTWSGDDKEHPTYSIVCKSRRGKCVICNKCVEKRTEVELKKNTGIISSIYGVYFEIQCTNELCIASRKSLGKQPNTLRAYLDK